MLAEVLQRSGYPIGGHVSMYIWAEQARGHKKCRSFKQGERIWQAGHATTDHKKVMF